MILLIDNYDSFVFNLQRYVQRLGQSTIVVRNDRIDMESIAANRFSAIIISPGPKAPDQAGGCLEVIERFHRHVPILGVCLGHQVICQALGGRIVRAPRAVHGQSSWVDHSDSRLLTGLPNPFQAARYHSLVAERDSLSSDLIVTGTSIESVSHPPIVMAVEHARFPLFGVQFHPESILSSVGYQILAKFLELAGVGVSSDLPDNDFTSSRVWENFQQSQSPLNVSVTGSTSDSKTTALAVLPPKIVPVVDETSLRAENK